MPVASDKSVSKGMEGWSEGNNSQVDLPQMQ